MINKNIKAIYLPSNTITFNFLPNTNISKWSKNMLNTPIKNRKNLNNNKSAYLSNLPVTKVPKFYTQ